MQNETSLAGTTIRVDESDFILIGHGADDPHPKVLIHLNEECRRTDGKAFRKLGIATGHELAYCVYLGLKYCPDFRRRATAYRIVSRKEKTVRCEVIKSDRSSEFVDRKVEELKVIFYENRAGREPRKNNAK